MNANELRAKADAMSKALNSAVNAYLMARTLFEVEKKKMDKLDAELTSEMVLTNRYTGERITNHELNWQMTDEQARPYYDERNRRLKAMGYDLPADYCPACMAEHTMIKAKRLVLEVASEYMPKLDPQGLLCAGMETYNKAVELCVGLCVNHPNYRKPKLVA